MYTILTRPGSWPERLMLILSFILACSGLASVGSLDSKEIWCYYYDHQKCATNGECDTVKEQCNNGSVAHGADEFPYFCYVLWGNQTKTLGGTEQKIDVMMKGCWYNHQDCASQKECISSGKQDELIFCCCDEDGCNENYTLDESSIPTPANTVANNPKIMVHDNKQLQTILLSLVPLAGTALLIIVAFGLWRRHKFSYHEPLPTQDPAPADYEPVVGLQPVQFLEVKANGRFGCVYKAQLMKQTVAVKIFPPTEKLSWTTEADIYNLPQINSHENILCFIGAEQRGDNVSISYWLITEYHDHGSLYDYLKGNLVTYAQALKFCQTMTSGLAFVHEEISPTKMELAKPAIAHRDFKSKNVLVKADMSTCIADFGLALKFEPGRNLGDAVGQVGTRRYMAPEVLEGAISFNRDAFLRIDMYACGLVMWEIVSRCSSVDGPVDDYQLPFEEEVGLHPNLEDMQDVVVNKKQRPIFKDLWLHHQGLAALSETIAECWDQDAEARLSASCVEERLTTMNNLTSTVSISEYRAKQASVSSLAEPKVAIVPGNVSLDTQLQWMTQAHHNQDASLHHTESSRPLTENVIRQQRPLPTVEVVSRYPYNSSMSSSDCCSSTTTTTTLGGATSLSSSPTKDEHI